MVETLDNQLIPKVQPQVLNVEYYENRLRLNTSPRSMLPTGTVFVGKHQVLAVIYGHKEHA